VSVAVLLAVATAALVVVLNIWVAATALRIVFLIGACLMIVALVFVIPPELRKRLGAPTAVFVAAAGTVSVFLASPEPSAAPVPPVVDAHQLAQYVTAGPFDQAVPEGLSVGALRRARIGDAVGSLAAVEVPIESDQFIVYAAVEVYDTPAAAARRGRADMEFRRETSVSPARQQTIAGFCFLIDPDAWECGGVRGHAYATTTLTPGANTSLPVATEITDALLRYADNKAKLATHQG
jgi:hypothetical protein